MALQSGYPFLSPQELLAMALAKPSMATTPQGAEQATAPPPTEQPPAAAQPQQGSKAGDIGALIALGLGALLTGIGAKKQHKISQRRTDRQGPNDPLIWGSALMSGVNAYYGLQQQAKAEAAKQEENEIQRLIDLAKVIPEGARATFLEESLGVGLTKHTKAAKAEALGERAAGKAVEENVVLAAKKAHEAGHLSKEEAMQVILDDYAKKREQRFVSMQSALPESILREHMLEQGMIDGDQFLAWAEEEAQKKNMSVAELILKNQEDQRARDHILKSYGIISEDNHAYVSAINAYKGALQDARLSGETKAVKAVPFEAAMKMLLYKGYIGLTGPGEQNEIWAEFESKEVRSGLQHEDNRKALSALAGALILLDEHNSQTIQDVKPHLVATLTQYTLNEVGNLQTQGDAKAVMMGIEEFIRRTNDIPNDKLTEEEVNKIAQEVARANGMNISPDSRAILPDGTVDPKHRAEHNYMKLIQVVINSRYEPGPEK